MATGEKCHTQYIRAMDPPSQQYHYNPTFMPPGAPRSETHDGMLSLTLGAGVLWKDTYAAASASGPSMIGEISGGGWLQGGGHSTFAPYHGLAVDNVVEFNLVIAFGGAAGGGGDIVELASCPLLMALFAANEYVDFAESSSL
ncbi:hypothetical protein BJ138DRAFT_1120827 [Hygrophoropsis aurantiaca]|uniref:Uncharacterized protein n=1 Tax=Hygrophoropsis aurantiaca TaxID=72124 RepID=A0ACB7ZQQ6_9AGAM|nr:hypothetical protein BJ138DRAFT_1120827 [Hygrophoropsis aurantiaca]